MSEETKLDLAMIGLIVFFVTVFMVLIGVFSDWNPEVLDRILGLV